MVSGIGYTTAGIRTIVVNTHSCDIPCADMLFSAMFLLQSSLLTKAYVAESCSQLLINLVCYVGLCSRLIRLLPFFKLCLGVIVC